MSPKSTVAQTPETRKARSPWYPQAGEVWQRRSDPSDLIVIIGFTDATLEWWEAVSPHGARLGKFRKSTLRKVFRRVGNAFNWAREKLAKEAPDAR